MLRVPLLIRVSSYCFLFHPSCAGNLVLHWSNKLSFKKKKSVHAYVRRFHVGAGEKGESQASEGEKVFEKYENRSFDVLDVQSRFLAKLSIEVMES